MVLIRVTRRVPMWFEDLRALLNFKFLNSEVCLDSFDLLDKK